jgi:thioredoxin reductase
MSFPIKHAIACIGTQGPAPVFASLGLQQIICTEGVCKISKEGAQLLMLTPELQTSVKGMYAIGGAVSPAYILISEKGVLREEKHTNLIYTAVKDGVRVVESIAQQKSQP